MSKNNIALSFEKSEYYTLQEASDYLNLKHGISNVTPKKLLKSIVDREINTYLHFTINSHDLILWQIDMMESNIIDCMMEDDASILKSIGLTLENLKKDYMNILVEEEEKIIKHISNSIFDYCYMGYILFKVDEHTLFNMSLNTNHKTKLYFFEGFLMKNSLQENPLKPSILKDWGFTFHEKNIYATEILHLCLRINSTDDKVLDFFAKQVPFDCSFEKRENGNFSFMNFHITIDDLIILHKDLETLENNIINNNPIPSKSPIEFKARKGVSQDKIIAMKLAKILAKNFWDNDKEQTIRIGEMASIVYRELHNNGFEQQLPQEQMSLKEWIKDIAPKYAQAGGRPTNQ